jgi:hypothetical protein
MALQPHGPAPYTTSTAAITILDAFRDRGLGVPVTTDIIIRAGVQESLGRRTLHSLKLLELVDDSGNPSEQWGALRVARGQEEYQAGLQEWLRKVYSDVLQYADPSTDDQQRIAEAFRSYEPAGQRKAMALLLIGLWKYSGLPVPEGTPERSTSTKPRTARPRPRPRAEKAQPKTASRMGAGTLYGGAAGTGFEHGMPPGLVGLLQQIPRDGKGWTEQDRDNFLHAFTAVLDFTVPIRPIGLEDLTDADSADVEVNSS